MKMFSDKRLFLAQLRREALIFFLIYSFCGEAQVFTGNPGNITGSGTYVFSINVSGLPVQMDSVYGLEAVGLNITHEAVEQLHIFLVSPGGTEVELTGTKSCSGSGFVNTILRNGSALSVAGATAPFTGTFSPLGNLGRFNNNKPGNGIWQLLVEHLSPASYTGAVNGWTLIFSASPAKPVILNSSNLPFVFINTAGATKLTESDALVSLGVIDNGSSRNYVSDAKNNFNGKALCHVRGSSSRMFEKENLKVELKDITGNLDTAVSLLGMPAESDWILTACYTDKTLIRNSFSQDLFRRMGHYSPRCHFVELVLNDEYYGVYLLMEQVKRGESRVDINKMGSSVTQTPEITGGYIVEVDRTNSPGWFSTYPGISANGAKFYYQYNYPNPEVITIAQKNYLKASLDSFENALAAQNFSDAKFGFRRFIDEQSFMDYLILQELSKNVDAYKLSMYLYKDNIVDGGKWHAGPVWDFDLAWHNANYGNAFSPDEWQHLHNNSSNPIPTWWRRFLEDPVFNDKLQCRYKSLRQTLLSHEQMFSYIDGMAEQLAESRERNFKQFPIIGAYVWPNPQVQKDATYETELADLKDWIINRTAWLDINVPGQCLDLSAEQQNKNAGVTVYPNPFADRFIIKAEPGCNLKLFDIAGHCLKEISESASSTHEIEMPFEAVTDGVYLLEVKKDCRVFFNKIVKVSSP
jgi:hypothetical protein